MTKLRILFVCTANAMRSATAHEMYRHDPRFEVLSAGTDILAEQELNSELLAWADAIVVMEKHHRQFIRKYYPEVYQQKRIVCLYLPDDYLYMEPELIAALRERVEEVYRRGLLG
jgi:predicted protein tyrosine phosphatase